ncbi:MAG: hypothetical protein M0D53_12395 [Flavobacterium sp. JAD_PAG50586_2]|nr:MAG: hypothetical protein M0D53_12395 [Flavobacterium sp. JAD_PAG50586_2]
MSLRINSVVNASEPNKEFVRLVSTTNLNLKGYALVDRTFDEDGEISNEFRHIYIFPDLDITPTDIVVLFTGNPVGNTPAVVKRENNSGNIYKLYWQSESCVWNDEGGDTATLIKYTVQHSKVVPAIEKK